MTKEGEELRLEEVSDADEEEDVDLKIAPDDQENEARAVSEKTQADKEESEFGALDEEGEELDEVSKLYEERKVQIDRSIVKMLSKSPISMRILKFLWERGGDYYRKQLVDRLSLPESTISYHLRKLCDAKIIQRIVPEPVNLRVRCYRVTNMELAEVVLRRFLWLTGFRLSKSVPYNYTSIEDLRKIPEFERTRRGYFLSFDEAVKALKLNNREIQKIFSENYADRGRLVGFKRILVNEIDKFQG